MRVERLSESVTLYLGDCREILPALGQQEAFVTDPPYGLGDKWSGGKREWPLHHRDGMEWDAVTVEFVHELPALAKHVIIWGGHLYRLPASRGWLIWDKKTRGFTSGDAELAWSTLDKPIRAISIARNVLTPAVEGKEHPTQKPIDLMVWSIERLPVTVRSICDPFMGSGTTGIAAARLGRQFIGIERESAYFDTACRRIGNELSRPSLMVC